MFNDDITSPSRIVAAEISAPLPAFLAVVETESNGKPFEQDGRTPCLLFERHVFYRELAARAPAKLPAAVKQGLALAKRSPKTQYKDQGPSAARLALLAKARAIDEDCANRSCSWGLGQTMGFLAEELDYSSATEMVATMTAGGVLAQLRMMGQEIVRKKLVAKLVAKDWAGFARVYNGPAYAENNYDTKLAAACRRWERTLGVSGASAAPTPRYRALAKYEVEAVQQRLVDLGYPEVGNVDGSWGTKTIGAVSAFQAHEGLPVSGDYDDATRAALAQATPRVVSDARADTTAADLRAAGSKTVATADRGRAVGWLLTLIGGAGGAQKTGLLDNAQSALDSAHALRPMVDSARDLMGWLASAWWIAALVGGVVVWRLFGDVIARRVADQISGKHA